MKLIIVGKNLEVSDALAKAIEDKLSKLNRYFTDDTTAHVTLSVQKDRQKIEVTVPVKGSIIRSEQESNDMYVSIDLVEEVLERQLRKYKKKIIDKHQGGENLSDKYINDEDIIYDEDGIEIVRTKSFDIKGTTSIS